MVYITGQDVTSRQVYSQFTDALRENNQILKDLLNTNQEMVELLKKGILNKSFSNVS